MISRETVKDVMRVVKPVLEGQLLESNEKATVIMMIVTMVMLPLWEGLEDNRKQNLIDELTSALNLTESKFLEAAKDGKSCLCGKCST